MIVHLIWSGDRKGGAQKVALSISKSNSAVITTSVLHGSLSKEFKKRGLKFSDNWFASLKSSDSLICSDYRTIFIALVARFILRSKYRVLGLIHSNRKKKIDYLLHFASKLTRSNDKFVVSTLEQIKYLNVFFNKHSLLLARFFLDVDQQLITGNSLNVMYFGRLSLKKKVEDYVRCIPDHSDKDRVYYIFGDEI